MRFRGSDIFSSACVTSATRTHIYRRLPLEASHCVLEYVLRLPGTSNAQDIFRYIIAARLYTATRSFFFQSPREESVPGLFLLLSLSHTRSHSRLPRGSPRFRFSSKILLHARGIKKGINSDAIIRLRNRIIAYHTSGEKWAK